jgi:acetyl esterase/lipase
MRILPRSFPFLCATVFLLQAAQATILYRDPQFKVKVVRNLQYATGAVNQPTAGKRSLSLDLYEPAGDTATKRPAMIAIHGGGFLFGDKSEMTNLCREMAARGYVCASINYRLVPDDPPGKAEDQYTRTVMAAVDDADHAAHWMEKNAAKYHVDVGRLFIGGSSAGAVVSMLYAYNPERKSQRVRAVADFWGTMGSRVTWIKKGDAPLFIVHGTEDDTITVSAARQIDARAREVGLPHQTFIIEGMEHSIPLNFEVGGETLVQHLVDFFYKQMESAGRH